MQPLQQKQVGGVEKLESLIVLEATMRNTCTEDLTIKPEAGCLRTHCAKVLASKDGEHSQRDATRQSYSTA